MTARKWQEYSFSIAVSPAGETGAQFLSYDPDLSRVRIDLASLVAETTIDTVTGTIEQGQSDYTPLTISLGITQLTVELSSSLADSDLDLTVYQGDHTNPTNRWASQGINSDESVSIPNPTAGNYEIEVTAYEIGSNAYNSGFEDGSTAGWVINGGMLALTSDWTSEGAHAGQATPDGSGGTMQVIAPQRPVRADTYTWSIDVLSSNGYGNLTADIDWLDADRVYISSTLGTSTSVTAGVAKTLTTTGTAPDGAVYASGKVSMRGTPAASDVLDVDNGRLLAAGESAATSAPWTVTITQTPAGAAPAGSVWRVQRSTDLIRWATVRGGTSIPVSADALPLDDYEFVADTDNHYRVQLMNGGSLIHTFTDAITPLLGGAAWLKSIARPFLNREITLAVAGDQTRRSRGSTFDIVGRSLPVAVTDLRGGREYELTLETSTEAEANDLEYALAAGDVMFLQVPAGTPIPGGYYSVGDVTRTWRGLPPAHSPTRWFVLPLTEVAAPDPSVVGTVATWMSTANAAASWLDLVALAETWADVTERVAGADDVIVG